LAELESNRTLKPARRFKELVYRTRKSWKRPRRMVARAEHTGGKANPRFVVTNLGLTTVARSSTPIALKL